MKSTIKITQGKTFTDVIRWGTDPLVSKPISAISFALGAPRLTVAGHGAPPNWPVAVTRVQGCPQINAENIPLREADFKPALFVDASTIELNSVVPVDDNGREWPAYTSGGFIVYQTPVDLTGYKARFVLKTKANAAQRLMLKCSIGGTSGTSAPTTAGTDGTVTWVATTEQSTKQWAPSTAFLANDIVDAKALLLLTEASGITLDNTNKKIVRTLSASITAALAAGEYVFELELESPTGVVEQIDAGTLTVSVETAP